MTADNKWKENIEKLRAKAFEEKKKGCPAEMLLYIANGLGCPYEVNPWYNQIKELSNGANFHFPEFYKAVIAGMYPELEGACDYFYHEVTNCRHDNDGKVTEEQLRQIEEKAKRMYNLKNNYSFDGPLSEEQQANVSKQLNKAADSYVYKELLRFSPVVQVIGQALKPNTFEESLELVSDMNILQISLGFKESCPERLDREELSEFAEVFDIADEIYKLKEQGIISEKFEIVDMERFRSSQFVRNITYKGETRDVSGKVLPIGVAVEGKIGHHSR